MKRTALIALTLVITLSSCGFYTCPTYTKKPVQKQDSIKEARI